MISDMEKREMELAKGYIFGTKFKTSAFEVGLLQSH